MDSNRTKVSAIYVNEVGAILSREMVFIFANEWVIMIINTITYGMDKVIFTNERFLARYLLCN